MPLNQHIFLTQELNRTNTFGKNDLKINEVIVKSPMMKLAKLHHEDNGLSPTNTVVKCTNYHLKDPKEVMVTKHTIAIEKEIFRVSNHF
jgi:hypothetical protein